jgi:hypothetical protein
MNFLPRKQIENAISKGRVTELVELNAGEHELYNCMRSHRIDHPKLRDTFSKFLRLNRFDLSYLSARIIFLQQIYMRQACKN